MAKPQILCDAGQVLETISEGRHVDHDYDEAMKEIALKVAQLYVTAKVARVGADDTHSFLASCQSLVAHSSDSARDRANCCCNRGVSSLTCSRKMVPGRDDGDASSLFAGTKPRAPCSGRKGSL